VAVLRSEYNIASRYAKYIYNENPSSLKQVQSVATDALLNNDFS